MMVETATYSEDLTTDFRGVDTTLPIMENVYMMSGAFPNDTTSETLPQPHACKFAYHPTKTPPQSEHTAEPESSSQLELAPKQASNLGPEPEQAPKQAPKQAPHSAQTIGTCEPTAWQYTRFSPPPGFVLQITGFPPHILPDSLISSG